MKRLLVFSAVGTVLLLTALFFARGGNTVYKYGYLGDLRGWNQGDVLVAGWLEELAVDAIDEAGKEASLGINGVQGSFLWGHKSTIFPLRIRPVVSFQLTIQYEKGRPLATSTLDDVVDVREIFEKACKRYPRGPDKSELRQANSELFDRYKRLVICRAQKDCRE